MSEIRLKPCPFCGRDLSKFPEVMTVLPVHSEEYLIAEMQHKKIIGSDKGYAVNCIKCGAVGARGVTKEEAVKKWNERADEKHGKWMLEREPDGKPYCFHCSICDSDFRYIGIKTAFDFCPNCGTKMETEEYK